MRTAAKEFGAVLRGLLDLERNEWEFEGLLEWEEGPNRLTLSSRSFFSRSKDWR